MRIIDYIHNTITGITGYLGIRFAINFSFTVCLHIRISPINRTCNIQFFFLGLSKEHCGRLKNQVLAATIKVIVESIRSKGMPASSSCKA